ncbi:isocitrate lyase/PEP mutase family protein [Sphingomicrobium flavum]|uniref:isocitrate lyase/PEP mutase family protein n=1 Tax=Sphingomicrobium flavum TaxID=1229164 RepID=UPI0021ADE772|nr:isocitrate lyase/phosphoenolpyruvate mutase family protein [Sphingomicrobium flavum]
MGAFAQFAALHVPGNPVILYNIWDAGSARAVEAAGAKAIATGSHPVADAMGLEDGENVPLDLAMDNVARIVEAVDLPVSVDFEGAYSSVPEECADNILCLEGAGAIGCNFEDQHVGGHGLHDLDLQVRRIAAMRKAVGDHFFINARTDLMLKKDKDAPTPLEEIIERGKAFADAGASGFFVPRLSDPSEVEKVVAAVPLPLNLIAFPGAPDKKVWADAGVARISHGPFPLKALMEKFGDMAKEALA